MRAIAEEASALVRRFKGAYSGEHGDGLARGEWIAWQFGPRLTEAFAAIKREFDPGNLFNPGKIVAPPKMDDGALFRFPPPSAPQPYRRIELKPALDWSAWNVHNDPLTEAISAPGTGGDTTGGLAMAVEMCNNNGHCRKFDAGTMCPSYRVTRDEKHLTRGRANTLRLALSGQLEGQLEGQAREQAFTSRDVYEALDLCVSCKGCKRECPTGVDMARLKIEFLSHYHARHGRGLKDRLIGALPDYAGTASRLAPLLTPLMRLRERVPLAARLAERLLGLAARRTLPRWRRDTFWRTPRPELRWLDAAGAARLARHGGKVAALFVDTFNGTFETENAWAAARVLQAAGYALHTPGAAARGAHLCCGRTHLAGGDVAAAKARLGALLDALAPLAQAGVPIVGLEPGCLFTLRDEALVMGLGERAERVAGAALMFEEFVAREAKAGRFNARFRPAGKPIALHGHCHQKAFGAVPPILEVLRLIPGAKPELIESSCCGMAGSFGYEARHHEVSMRMAEAALLPALRARADAIVVADGTSCRHQIRDGAAREALHVARLLESLLVGGWPTPA
jgi:Fe-S oxidoreductase